MARARSSCRRWLYLRVTERDKRKCRALPGGREKECKASGNRPRLVFASSAAVFGNDPGVPLPPVIRDDTLPTPQTSYGIQKFICEQLIADYTRRGFLDGRSARLMTV